MLTTPQVPGTTYTIAVADVHDLAAQPNAIAQNTHVSFTACSLVRGFLLREVYDAVAGEALFTLTNHAKFPDKADQAGYISEFSSPRDAGDNYGVRLSGFLAPPDTGEYRFFLSAGGVASLFLSTDEQPENLRLIAYEPKGGGYRDWTGMANRNSEAPENRSIPVALEAGRLYYVEALMKARTGHDHLDVTWRKTGDPEPDRWDPPIPAASLATLASPDGAEFSIAKQPEDIRAPEGSTVVFRVSATTTSPAINYQWQRNGVDVPGAIFSDYQHTFASLDDNGAAFRCLIRIPGVVVSSDEAILTVVPDTEPPVPVAAEGSIGRTRVWIDFSEPLNPYDAANPANYSINGGLVVERARLLFNGRRVLLRTSPQVENALYQVSFNNIRDLSAAGNAVLNGTIISFVGWSPEEFVGPFSSWADAKADLGAVADGLADDTTALQSALDSIGWSGSGPMTFDRPHVLFLPAGTYRITSTLRFDHRISVSMIGEDPESTRILWDGPEGGVMLDCNGASYHRVSRLTFDGAARAYSAIDHIWDGTNQPHATSGSEYSDLIIRDVVFGIRGGGGAGINDDSVSVLRCHFRRCSQSGISLGSYNALNWWAWHCTFEECGVGVENTRYAGACHVYDSLFLRSINSDLVVGNCSGYVSFRRNTSIESSAFFQQGLSGCPVNLTLQGNTIIDPVSTVPIAVFSQGPVLLLDNTVRSRPEVVAGPVVIARDNLIAIGNTFTVASPLHAEGQVIAFDNCVVRRDELDWDPHEPPGFQPKRQRPIFEVASGAAASTIQAVINQAATLSGQRPVVHFPRGIYRIDRTLVVPPESDVQLVGDGFLYSSMIEAESLVDGPAIHLAGPTRATLRDITISGADHGVMIDRADQPGSRLIAERVSGGQAARNDVRFDRLRHLTADFQNFAHGGAVGLHPSILVVGPDDSHGATTRGVRIYGAGANDPASNYYVDQGGRLLVQDCWYEVHPGGTFLNLNGDGQLTIHGAVIAPDPTGLPAVLVDGFAGDLVLLNTGLGFPENRVGFKAPGLGLESLLLGVQGFPGFLEDHASDADVRVLMLMENAVEAGMLSRPDQGSGDPAFLRRMLAHTRESVPSVRGPIVPGATDVRLFGVHLRVNGDGLFITDENHGPPRLRPTPMAVIEEGATLALDVIADDPDLPYTRLNYALEGPVPFGVTLNRVTGRLIWATDETAGPGNYSITVKVTDDGSPRLTDRMTISISVAERNERPQLGLPVVMPSQQSLSLVDLGAVTPLATMQSLGGGNYDLYGRGAGFWWESGSFAYETVTGDFDVRVRLEGIQLLTPDTQAGLLVREFLQPGSRSYGIFGQVAGIGIDGRESYDQLQLLRREERGADAQGWGPSTSGHATYPNQWIRLQRVEQTFIAFRSSDGQSWLELVRSEAPQPMPKTLFVGLGASAGTSGQTSVARFREYQNRVEALAPISDLSVVEGQTLTMGLRALDPDLPQQSLVFTLDSGAPVGATIDPTTGVFEWTPGFDQGPATYPITIRVTDDGEPALSSALSFTVAVEKPPGFEADVAPRPDGSGNGKVTVADWVQVGRFVAGLDVPSSESEFQRADCAPRDTFGNGQLSVSDWVQAGRYAAGLDPIVPAAGPRVPLASESETVVAVPPD